MCCRDENGGSFHDPPLNVARLLLVDDQQVVGVQPNSVPHQNGLHLQTIVKYLSGTAGHKVTKKGSLKQRQRACIHPHTLVYFPFGHRGT